MLSKLTGGDIIGLITLSVILAYLFRDGKTTTSIIQSGSQAFTSVLSTLQGNQTNTALNLLNPNVGP